MKCAHPALILVFAILLASQVTYAADQGGQSSNGSRGGLREACNNDARSFCQDVQPGGGRIINCLKDHYKEVSDACYAALKTVPAISRGGESGGAPTPSGEDEGQDTSK